MKLEFSLLLKVMLKARIKSAFLEQQSLKYRCLKEDTVFENVYVKSIRLISCHLQASDFQEETKVL